APLETSALRRWGFVPGAESRGTAAAFALIVVLGLTVSGLTSPLGARPVAADLQIQAGNVAPTSHDKALTAVLDMIPVHASVLTTWHLFPLLSNRPGAFVVPDHAFLPHGETYANDINLWVARSQFVAVDYVVDPVDTLILLNDSDLSAFGVYASEGGALILERGWTAPPVLWVPDSSTISGGSLVPIHGSIDTQYGAGNASVFYHHKGDGAKGDLLWDGPGAATLPPGTYSVTFSVAIMDPKGPVPPHRTTPQILFQVDETPGYVRDLIQLSVGGRDYHAATYHSTRGNATVLGHTWLNSSAPIAKLTQMNRTVDFTLNHTGYVDFPGIEESVSMSVYLLSVTVTQLSGVP
ncbi:MAG TPA: hypothetical protein VJQ43_04285, partial [Thermoplasmata archaeon]|nr:hypothetical protein [Thermoplasmata archaeon]